ncbi:hypothetical protein PVW49_12265 [Marinovum sp. PR37]|nr:DUF6884 domain-containing protein [Marinovum sp. PR37]MDD9744733.1 hypothetical protein [Marinovum sp. PR37]
MKQVILVSCVAGKKPALNRAADLYTSAWFIKARRLVEAAGAPWFILSAEHGLLDPETMVGPYDKTLNTMSAAERRAWAKQVRHQMDATLPDADEVVVLAGNRYRECLMPYLRACFPEVSVPMQGLTIGRQLSWMSNAKTL